MKKILLITTDLSVGGSQQHFILFANFLVQHDRQVTIINLSNINELANRLHRNVQLINVPRKFGLDPSPKKFIKEFLLKTKIENIFCNGLFSYLFVPALKYQANTAVIFHNTTYRHKYAYYKDLGIRLLLKKNVMLIGISKNQISSLSKSLQIPIQRFQIAYNGIDVSKFNIEQRELHRNPALRENLKIPENSFVIIKVARFDVEKNHEMALEVLHSLRQKFDKNIVLLFAGGGNEQRLNKIKQEAIDRNLYDNVRFLGIQKDVRPYLTISDLFILTSKSVETFSLSALEAMAFGLPCVLTDIGGANEMIKDGKNGYVVSHSDTKLFTDRINDVFQGKLTWSAIEISKNIYENYDSEKTYATLTAKIEELPTTL